MIAPLIRNTEARGADCGSDLSTDLGRKSIVWMHHNGIPHTSGIAHFGGELAKLIHNLTNAGSNGPSGVAAKVRVG